MRPAGMWNYVVCRNFFAAFTKDPRQAARRFTQLPVRLKRGLRDPPTCFYRPALDSMCRRESGEFASQTQVCLQIWTEYASKTCGLQTPPLIFLSAGTDQLSPSKFCVNTVTSKSLNPRDQRKQNARRK